MQSNNKIGRLNWIHTYFVIFNIIYMVANDKALEWMLKMKEKYDKEIPERTDQAIANRDEWFFVALSALLEADQSSKKEFIKQVKGKHIDFPDGSVWREDLLFP